jgi:hypothetical protein
LTDGQKRLYERAVRWAGQNGIFWYAFETMAEALGKSVRQIKDDMAVLEARGLIKHIRRRRQSNVYSFLWHPIFDVRSTALQEGNLEVQDSFLEVQDNAVLKVQPTAQESSPIESCPLNCVKATEADSQPTNRKTSDSPAVSPFAFTEKHKSGTPKTDWPAKAAGDKPLPGERQKAESRYLGDWTDQSLAAVEELLDNHPPETLKEWEQIGKVPEWLPQATLDAGLGDEAEEVLAFLLRQIESCWIPPNWKAYPAVVRNEFERRRRRGDGRQWSVSELAMVRKRIEAYMGDEPPDRFEYSCELRACGATPKEVCELLDRKYAKKKYRPGAQHGPRGWNWFLKVIGSEFSTTERSHFPEPPAESPLEHQMEPEAMNRGIEAIELANAPRSIVESVRCAECGGCALVRYADGSIEGCQCRSQHGAGLTRMPPARTTGSGGARVRGVRGNVATQGNAVTQ